MRRCTACRPRTPSSPRSLKRRFRRTRVLTAPQTARWMPAQLEQLDAARRSVALQQVMSRQALEVSSQRFAALQTLINAIPAATDAKATLDLQARIAAEEAMLQNEHTKLMVLHADRAGRRPGARGARA